MRSIQEKVPRVHLKPQQARFAAIRTEAFALGASHGRAETTLSRQQ